MAGTQWGFGIESAESPGPQRNQPFALGFECRHSFLTVQSGSRPHVEMHAIFGDLVFWNLLEEDPWAAFVRVLDGRSLLSGTVGLAATGPAFS